MPALTRREVDDMLVDTQRAEQPGILQEYLDASVQTGNYPNLERNDTEDGSWACCSCLRETTLVHVKGPHPFKHLDCIDCGHILCEACETTDIIVPWDQNRTDWPLSRTGELRLFQVCPGCGLSYRATAAANRLEKAPRWPPLASHFASCLCAEPAGSAWLKYMIGQPYTYRMNTERAKHECQERLAKKKAESLWERLEKQDGILRERVDSVCAATSMLSLESSRERRPDMNVKSSFHEEAVEIPGPDRIDADLDQRSLLYTSCHAEHFSKPADMLPEQPSSSPALATNDMHSNANMQPKVSSIVPKNEEWEALYLLADKTMKLTEGAKPSKELETYRKTKQAEDDPFESLKWLEKDRESLD